MVAVEFLFLRLIDSRKWCAVAFAFTQIHSGFRFHVLFCLGSDQFSTAAGTGFSHQGKPDACFLLWLKANSSVQDGMVRAKPPCWRIPQLQHQATVQCEICDTWGRSFCCCSQGHQEWLGGVCELQSSLAPYTDTHEILQLNTLSCENRGRTVTYYFTFGMWLVMLKR